MRQDLCVRRKEYGDRIHSAKKIQDAAVYILVLDLKESTVTVYPYGRDNMAAANARYAKLEKEQPELQAVLVSVDSLDALKAAYPNYFSDTTTFVSLVTSILQVPND
jgi:hypothetical protein